MSIIRIPINWHRDGSSVSIDEFERLLENKRKSISECMFSLSKAGRD
jgi:hypothetical protein